MAQFLSFLSAHYLPLSVLSLALILGWIGFSAYQERHRKKEIVVTSTVGCIGCISILFMIATIVSCILSAISISLRAFFHV